MLEALPSLVLLADKEKCGSMRWAVERILSEMRDPRPDGTVIAQQVASTVLVDALRLYLEEQESRPGWFHDLAEPQMGMALSCLHENPARAWTLGDLARASGLFRTSLASEIAEAAQWTKNLGSELDWFSNQNQIGAWTVVPSLSPWGKVLGGGSSINPMGWMHGHESDWESYAGLTGDAGWSFDNIKKTFLEIEAQQGEPSHERGTSGILKSSKHLQEKPPKLFFKLLHLWVFLVLAT